ncbi:hypothetical protein MMC31_004784 [Peltigera leucophlebia]|nr:hypothetical protein [Peltigera leucophlebia]
MAWRRRIARSHGMTPRSDQKKRQVKLKGLSTLRPHSAEDRASAPPSREDIGGHELTKDEPADSKEKGELSRTPAAVPSSVDARRNILADAFTQGGSGKQLSTAPAAVPSSVDARRNAFADSSTQGGSGKQLSTAPAAVPSSVDARRNTFADSSTQSGSGKHIPKATDYSESKEAIGDMFMELSRLFHKSNTDDQAQINNGQTEILERMNQLGREIAQCSSDIIARQEEVAERINLAEAEIKKSLADLEQQFLRQGKQMQDYHAHTVNIRVQHHKEVLAKKDRNEKEEKARFEESMRQQDQAHRELMAKLDRQDQGITQILIRLQAVEARLGAN